MSGTVLLPVCTFRRVFETTPCSEVLTLPELTLALRRFEVKTQTMVKIEREVARTREAVSRLAAGEPPRGKIMGILAKVADRARKEGRDPSAAVESRAKELEDEARRSAKRDLRLWSPALYRPGADKRGSENVTHVSCLVLDYDDGTSVAEASMSWSAWFHIVHTTWSHTAERPKLRVVLPLAFPVAAEDWPKVWSWAEERTRFEIDPSMKSPAATYALPAVPHRAWPRRAFSRPGAILDPVDEGILEWRTVLELAPKRPPAGVPSVIRGEDPEHDYVDHDEELDPELDEDWTHEADWDPPEELVAVVRARAPEVSAPEVGAPEVSAPEVSAPEVSASEVGAPEVGAPEVDAQEERSPEAVSVGPDREAPETLVERLEAALARLEALSEAPALVTGLERLVALHRDGWLTADELAEAKRRLLASGEEVGELRRVGPGRHRRTLAIDFDGVLHSYASGWQGATSVPDPPVEGAIAWLTEAAERFDLAIWSVRTAHPGALEAMRAWLRAHGLPERVLERLRFPLAKPPAELYIDDRAYRFEGTFPSFDELATLEPWTRAKLRQDRFRRDR